ncbi:dihydroxyacetone kinase subunit DhaK [Tuanshanicoccus lijuaniae]|uniref:dihydroxyacetone kinase subunit DhaK n=1 Tax=Aerococcaceae bacterium zg-1292 TaxID=2774330 RepID=UPI0040630DD7
MMSHLIKYSDNEIIIDNLIKGFTNTYDHITINKKSKRVVQNKTILKNKVILIGGGGSGHEPAHIGYIGVNMLDVAVVGDIFEPPTLADIMIAIRETYNGHGTLLIIKNFEKDLDVFLKAECIARKEGFLVDHVIVTDDCSVKHSTFIQRKRGVAGTILVHKILGTASKKGYTLDQIKNLGDRVINEIKTIGVAFSSNDSIGNIKKQYDLHDDEMYFGIGIHGEPGYRKEKNQSSERIAVELFNKLNQQFYPLKLDKIALLVNGLGGASLLDLSIFMAHITELLDIENISPVYKLLGNFLTSYNTNGLSLTFLNIIDDDWIKLLNEPTNAFGWPH